jgi:hypothetical protein
LDGTIKLWYGKVDAATWEKRKWLMREQEAAKAIRERQWFAGAFLLEQLVKRDPGNLTWFADLGQAHAELKRWDKAAFAFAAAGAVATKADDLSADKRRQLAESYSDKTIAMLKLAIAHGFRDVANLKANAAWAALRHREDFQALIRQLETKDHGKQ